jgi:hypothetical protein
VGTAVVSLQSPGYCEHILLDYEEPGWGDGPAERFADRVDAAGRQHVTPIWPVKQLALPAGKVTLVAIYDPDRGIVCPYGPPAEGLIAKWCGVGSICEVPLIRSSATDQPAVDEWAGLAQVDELVFVALASSLQ